MFRFATVRLDYRDGEGVPPSSVPRVKRDHEDSLLRDRRVHGLIAVSLLFGFLIGMVFFGQPWHLPPDWGDVPTWLLVGLAAAAAWVGFVQLAVLRKQIAEEVERNRKRDKLFDKQIEEAERRARSEQRQLVEGLEVRFTGTTGYVKNNSKRPINEITCKIMSKVDRGGLALPAACGEIVGDGITRTFLDEPKPVSRFETLPPGATCGFTFHNLTESPDQVLVAWFADDDEFRWQLDQYQHLVQTDDESLYLPVKTTKPLRQYAPTAIGGAAASASRTPPAPAPQAPDPADSTASREP